MTLWDRGIIPITRLSLAFWKEKAFGFLSNTSHFVAISLLSNHAWTIKMTAWKTPVRRAQVIIVVLCYQHVEECKIFVGGLTLGKSWSDRKLCKHYKTCIRLYLSRIWKRGVYFLADSAAMILFVIWVSQFITFFLSVIDGTCLTSPHSSYTLSFLYWEWSLGLCLTRW